MTTRGFFGITAVHLPVAICLLAAGSACSGETDPIAKPMVPDAGPTTSPDWPSYGRDHDNSRTNTEEKTITKSNAAALELRWSFSDSAVTSTPSVYKGVVYFGDWN